MIATLTVAEDDFDLLAGGGGDLLGVMRAGQRSKRLVLLHDLRSTASQRTPQTCADANLGEAFAVLADAQRRSRHAVDEVLLQPHVGAWATSCLRDLLSNEGPPPEDVGHAGAIAAAAALHAGQSFEVTTYLRDGSLMLPTYGTARSTLPSGWCRIRSRPGAGGIEISTADTTHAIPFEASTSSEAPWLPLRRLRSSVAGVTIDVQLDDLDPFRGCGHLPVAPRLDAIAADDWQTKLDEAWALLVDDHRASAEAIAAGVASVVPLRPTESATELSATCHEAIGAVAMTPPPKALSMALALVHEFQHTKLSALLDLVPLLERSTDKVFYAPWRPDPRPLSGLLQGTYAFLGLAMFWEVNRRWGGSDDMPGRDEWGHFELAMGRSQVTRALNALQGSGLLRPPGVRFVDGMRRRVALLDQQPVPPRPGSFAHLACLDNATAWRLRNLRPDADQVAAGTAAWLAGRGCPWPSPPHAATIDGGGPIPSSARLDLFRRQLAWPGRGQDDFGSATPADALLVDGRLAQAADTYRAQLGSAPDDLASWAGLALARRELRTPATWALTTCPESVYALHREIRARRGVAPDVEDLATWVAGCVRNQN